MMQLLERMAMSVKMEEGVLLVGESGVGKTSLVQVHKLYVCMQLSFSFKVLADMRGEKLATVNLGPHTDTDDLLTRYNHIKYVMFFIYISSLRPTSYGRLMAPFTKDFIDLFTRSFDPSKNEKFLHNLEVNHRPLLTSS